MTVGFCPPAATIHQRISRLAMIRAKLAVSFLFLAAMHSPAMADNWPQWRGPQGNGVAEDGAYPTDFSAEENVDWKVELPGVGSSTPAVWGDQIFVTCGVDGKDGILCFGMDGKEQWR